VTCRIRAECRRPRTPVVATAEPSNRRGGAVDREEYLSRNRRRWPMTSLGNTAPMPDRSRRFALFATITLLGWCPALAQDTPEPASTAWPTDAWANFRKLPTDRQQATLAAVRKSLPSSPWLVAQQQLATRIGEPRQGAGDLVQVPDPAEVGQGGQEMRLGLEPAKRRGGDLRSGAGEGAGPFQ
jgi:hypothetical protein